MDTTVAERNGKLLEKELFPDITFILGDEKVSAHRGILSLSSTIFRRMFEDNGVNEFQISDTDSATFQSMLKHLYTNEDPNLSEENWAPLLRASEEYDVKTLKRKCISYVLNHCKSTNALEFFTQAKANRVENFVPFIMNRIVLNSENSLNMECFYDLKDKELLKEILSSDKLNCDEMTIFRTVLSWAYMESGQEEKQVSLREAMGILLYTIRFPRLTPDQFIKEVLPTNILTNEEIINILKNEPGSPFNSTPRIRSFSRFGKVVEAPIRNKNHSIKFKINNYAVKVRGLGLYKPCDNEEDLRGKLYLKDDGNEILGEASFNIFCDAIFRISIVDFPYPIIARPNVWYTVCVEYDTFVTTRMGRSGQKSNIPVDGVEITFANDPSSSEETCVDQGQIPLIKFSRCE